MNIKKVEPMTATLEIVDIKQIKPHPMNPRVQLRADVVDQILQQLKADKQFKAVHALHVRPVNGHFQILSGHHRIAAAQQAGISELPCWIEEMNDDDAYMQLVLSNAQGELSPLEIGMHVLGYVQRQKGGGLKAYGQRIGKTQQYVSQLRDAAEVAQEISNKSTTQVVLLLEKAKHLSLIHSLPRNLWAVAAEAMLTRKWSKQDTAHWVKQMQAFGYADSDSDAPIDKWAFWLPGEFVIERFLATREFSPSTVEKLRQIADAIESTIQAHADVIDVDSYLEDFRAWLIQDVPIVDPRKLTEYQRKLLAELQTAELEFEKRWNLGNWREHIKSLAPGSVHLLLTDPPYGMNFQSDYKLDRRQHRNHSTIANDDIGAFDEVKEMLAEMMPTLAENAHVLIFCHWSTEPEMREVIATSGLKLRGSLIWVKNATGMGDPSTTFAPKHERILHAVKGSPVLLHRAPDVLEAARVQAERHPTEKPVDLLQALITATTAEGELVADPFGGVASTLVAARSANRKFWGCEVKEEYFNLGKERLADGK